MLRRREKAGLTQKQVADKVAALMGKVQIATSYICILEHPGDDGNWLHEVQADFAESLMQVLPDTQARKGKR